MIRHLSAVPPSPDAPIAGAVVALVDAEATWSLAARLAPLARAGDIVALQGGLGAGKTTFARGFINALSRTPEEVPSPTFTLVQTYDTAPAPVWHFDLYRLQDPDEVYELDIEDAFADGISLIEWPERLGPLLPGRALRLRLEITADGGRRAAFAGGGNWPDRLKEAGLG